MADIRCPNCGKDNPETLDRCQFCQAPLKSGSSLHTGESPTKKNTGELEPILPDWLKDLRQQARKSAEEDATEQEARLTSQKKEPPDLLAGLASQANTGDDEIPDWLASLGPANKARPSGAPSPQAGADFFAQFDQGKSEPSAGQADLPARMEETQDQPEGREDKDELSEWFSRTAGQASEPFTIEPGLSEDDPGWMRNLDAPGGPSEGPASPKEAEDLSWLYNLEASAKQSVEPSQPAKPPAPQEELGWLDELGKTRKPSQPGQPSAPPDDLSWLNSLGSPSETSQEETAKPAPQEDLSWLSDLGKAAEPSRPKPAQPAPPEDLSWLKNMQEMGEAPAASSPVFSPRRTAPLSEEAESESAPDWLRSAAEEPSMPPLGAGALDWLDAHDLEKSQLPAAQEPGSSEEEVPQASLDEAPEAVPTGSEISSSPAEPATGSSRDVDSLFSIDMPDWLSQSATADTASREASSASTERDDSLAPVELPSWVQAMRPVEAVISETSPGVADQPPESEGPLAGLSGVIPLVPIGSSRRPKAISLKLQATSEQQASAALLEQMLAAETSPRALETASPAMPQRTLRWALTGLVVLVLGAMIGLRSRSMPVSPTLPVEVDAVLDVIASLPDSPTPEVLVVVDYEPSLAGEMEAVSSPVLNQMANAGRARLSFLSTSPNGPALVERLMANTALGQPPPAGAGDRPGEEYLNLGYLPGGSAGVLAFVESPQTAIRAAGLEDFSQYAAVLVLTDRAESGRVWVEQLEARKRTDSALASQPLLVVASAQAGPLLQPYAASRQVTGLISGLPDAARYELASNLPPGIARTYWDTFGVGLLLAILSITFGSLWNLLMRIRPRRVDAEGG
ncbi:MAG TPA: hypothetical protein VI524_13700 [Anaerolineales bacterium]|nr:hypothetical protein [Anaerolineales bacterium]